MTAYIREAIQVTSNKLQVYTCTSCKLQDAFFDHLTTVFSVLIIENVCTVCVLSQNVAACFLIVVVVVVVVVVVLAM